MPPRAAQPSQRSHYISRPMDEDRVAGRPSRRHEEPQEEEAAAGRKVNFFQRMAGMGASRDEQEQAPAAQRRVEVTENKKPDVRDSNANSEDDYLDIPAFLRRQAN